MKAIGIHTSQVDLLTARDIAIPTTVTMIRLQVFAQNVRYTIDGTTAPTVAIGFQLVPGVPLDLAVPSGGTLKVIEEAATATLVHQKFGD